MDRKLQFPLIGLLLGVWALAACAQAQPASPSPMLQPAVATSTAATDGVESTSAPVVSAPQEVPVRQELAASDPAGVKLASGEVQLVEFFAFW